MAALPSRNPALVRRAAVTLTAVLLLDLVAVTVLAALLRPWLAPLADAVGTATGLAIPPAIGWLGFGLVALLVFLGLQVRYTRQAALAAVAADPVTPESHPALHARLTRLAQGTDLPVPALAVAPTGVPNCLTVGGPRSATVVVSEGLLDALDGEELDAALAHELAHVKNGDVVVMTLAAFLPALARGEYPLLAALSPPGVSPRATGGLLALGFALLALGGISVGGPVGPLLGVVVLAAFSLLFGGVVLGLLAAPMVGLATRLSRTREFAADRAGALLTGKPAVLATVLTTLGGDAPEPTADLRRATVQGMCLLPHGFDGEGDGASHPSVEERVARLRELQAALDG